MSIQREGERLVDRFLFVQRVSQKERIVSEETTNPFDSHPVEDVAATVEMFERSLGRLMEKASKEHHRLSSKPGVVPELIELLPAQELSMAFTAWDFCLRAECGIAAQLERQIADVPSENPTYPHDHAED